MLYGPAYKDKHCVKRRVKSNCICIVVLLFLQAVLSTLFVPTETYGSLKKLSLSVWVLLLITGHWDTRTKNWFSYFFRLTSADYSFWVRCCCMVRFIKVKILLRFGGHATAGGGTRYQWDYSVSSGLRVSGEVRHLKQLKKKKKYQSLYTYEILGCSGRSWYSEESVVVFVESSYHLAFLFWGGWGGGGGGGDWNVRELSVSSMASTWGVFQGPLNTPALDFLYFLYASGSVYWAPDNGPVLCMGLFQLFVSGCHVTSQEMNRVCLVGCLECGCPKRHSLKTLEFSTFYF